MVAFSPTLAPYSFSPNPSMKPSPVTSAKQPDTWINGKPLSAMEWLTQSLTVAPSLHRLSNAVGLTAGLYTGMTVMDNVMGTALRTGKKTGLEQYHPMVQPLLKPFHNAIGSRTNYNYWGADVRNRSLKLAHFAGAAALGMAGNMAGSYWYFRKQQQQAQHPEFIDDYSQRIAFDQSKPWWWMSGASALANVGIGLNFLPFSYGMNMGMRFTLASDRRITLPGAKEYLSNNHSYYPYGPAKLRNYLINYMVYSPDEHPKQLSAMSHAILEPWFSPQPEGLCEGFAQKILDIRNKYYEEGGIPKNKIKDCKADLEKHFKGIGLHQTLAELGVDVLSAHIDDTGWMGRVAERLGARADVRKDMEEFRSKEILRRREHPELIPRHPGSVIATDGISMEKTAPQEALART